MEKKWTLCSSNREDGLSLLSLPQEVLDLVVDQLSPEFPQLRCVCKKLNVLVSRRVQTLHITGRCCDERPGGSRRRQRNAEYNDLPAAFPCVKNLQFDSACNPNDIAHLLTRVSPLWPLIKMIKLPCGSSRPTRKICSQTGETGLRSISSSCAQITKLQLSIAPCKRNMQLLRGLTCLESLRCEYVGKLCQGVKQLLPSTLTRLTCLALSLWCEWIANEFEFALDKTSPLFAATQLQTLALVHVQFLGIDQLRGLLQLTGVQRLHLGGCEVFNCVEAVRIVGQMTALKELHLAVRDSLARAPPAAALLLALEGLHQLHVLEVAVEDGNWGTGRQSACLPKLEKMIVAIQSKLTTAEPLPAMPELKSLELRLTNVFMGDNLSGLKTMISIPHMPKVVTVSVQTWDLQQQLATDLQHLKCLPQLKVLLLQAAHDSGNGSTQLDLQQVMGTSVQVLVQLEGLEGFCQRMLSVMDLSTYF